MLNLTQKIINIFTFKARAGSRDKLKIAAETTNQSLNGFIRGALNKAVEEVTGKPMETEKLKGE